MTLKNEDARTFVKLSEAKQAVVSTAEYRRLAGDILTPDDLVARRLRFLERLCRSIIRSTLQEHANKDKNADK